MEPHLDDYSFDKLCRNYLAVFYRETHIPHIGSATQKGLAEFYTSNFAANPYARDCLGAELTAGGYLDGLTDFESDNLLAAAVAQAGQFQAVTTLEDICDIGKTPGGPRLNYCLDWKHGLDDVVATACENFCQVRDGEIDLDGADILMAEHHAEGMTGLDIKELADQYYMDEFGEPAPKLSNEAYSDLADEYTQAFGKIDLFREDISEILGGIRERASKKQKAMASVIMTPAEAAKMTSKLAAETARTDTSKNTSLHQ